jgi:hypothetical protein
VPAASPRQQRRSPPAPAHLEMNVGVAHLHKRVRLSSAEAGQEEEVEEPTGRNGTFVSNHILGGVRG